MFKKFLPLIAGLCLPFISLSQGHTTISANTPRMVVGIVIEDFNPDYIERYWEKFGEGGFQRIFSRDLFVPTTTMIICSSDHQ